MLPYVVGCFGKSVDCLLSELYAAERRQIYGGISHYVPNGSKTGGSDGRKLTSKDISNVQSLHNLVRTDQAYKLFKNLFLESQTAALHGVGIGDERIILQWHLLDVRAD